jgi:hypothetical protein
LAVTQIDGGISSTEVKRLDLLKSMQTEGVPFLDKIHVPRDFARKIGELTAAPNDPNVKEAWCYSLLLAEEHAKGTMELVRLAESINELRIQYPDLLYLEEERQRISKVLAALRIDPDSARVILDGWRAQTLAGLKLP